MTFLNEGFEFKGRRYKALTAQTLIILESVKSPFYTGEDKGVKGLLDFLFVSSREAREVLALTKDLDAFNLAVLDFASDFSAADLDELGKIVAEQNAAVAAVVVEPVDDSKKKAA